MRSTCTHHASSITPFSPPFFRLISYISKFAFVLFPSLSVPYYNIRSRRKQIENKNKSRPTYDDFITTYNNNNNNNTIYVSIKLVFSRRRIYIYIYRRVAIPARIILLPRKNIARGFLRRATRRFSTVFFKRDVAIPRRSMLRKNTIFHDVRRKDKKANREKKNNNTSLRVYSLLPFVRGKVSASAWEPFRRGGAFFVPGMPSALS